MCPLFSYRSRPLAERETHISPLLPIFLSNKRKFAPVTYPYTLPGRVLPAFQGNAATLAHPDAPCLIVCMYAEMWEIRALLYS